MIPEGWKLVPEFPSIAMIKAGAASIDDNGGDARWSDIREAWADMLAAAPTPPAQPTVTVRYDLSAATTEGAIRDKLIELGWTPPAQDDEALELLRWFMNAAEWPRSVSDAEFERQYKRAEALIAKRGKA